MDDFGLLVGQYNSTLPTIADGKNNELQLDINGRLIIRGQHDEDAAHSSGDPGLFMLAVRNDTEGSLVSADGDYAPFQVDSSGRLRVVADIDVTNQSEKDEDSAHVSGDTGSYVLAVRADSRPSGSNVSADGDYASFFVNDSGEQYVKDTDLETAINNGQHAEDDAHSSGDLGTMALAVRSDTKASTAGADGDYAALIQDADGDLYVSDTVAQGSLASIDTAIGNIETSIDNIEADVDALRHNEDDAHVSGDSGTMALAVRSDTKASTAGTDGDYAALIQDADGDLYVSDTVAQGSLASLDTSIGNLEHAEDSAHSSGDSGVMSLAVRADSDGSLVSADGDYAPLQVDADGKLKVVGSFGVAGTEAYNATDDLAAAADGQISGIAGTFTDVCSVSVGAGTTAYLYGYSWAADKNAEMRIVTDDTSDVIVYKKGLNSSAMPGVEAHWNDGGRIEIPGAANLEIKLQVKKRFSAGPTANATGSLHVRTV